MRVRLITFSLPKIASDEGAILVGLQDKKQEVYSGRERPDQSTAFECELEVSHDFAHARAEFKGSFVHGTPGERFLYLGWKRAPGVQPPWVQRVKIPLAALTWERINAAGAGAVFQADITGRKPHATDLIVWKVRQATE